MSLVNLFWWDFSMENNYSLLVKQYSYCPHNLYNYFRRFTWLAIILWDVCEITFIRSNLLCLWTLLFTESYWPSTVLSNYIDSLIKYFIPLRDVVSLFCIWGNWDRKGKWHGQSHTLGKWQRFIFLIIALFRYLHTTQFSYLKHIIQWCLV